ncbi:hypothetical protein VNO80_18910 [Phaseolus coccineus]|uniref:Uncharacterized protein n=1 Tax=Phaseolus coccineus TaxID=3886 RepID=A0AAN9R485_PHACN
MIPCSTLLNPNIGFQSFHHHGRLHLAEKHYSALSRLDAPVRHEPSNFICRSALVPGGGSGTLNKFGVILTRTDNRCQKSSFNFAGTDNSSQRNSFNFAKIAIYIAVLVAGMWLLTELLGYSKYMLLTANGLGTAFLSSLGCQVFGSFLSSIRIHATRPFMAKDWIQIKIEGNEVSGTVKHVGWWSPTTIIGEDLEEIHIFNNNFTVVRNLSLKSHWRIKTYIAISHHDISKISNIVADMRKLLSKNPRIEQEKLHKRVFMESFNHENQALMILVSCFVRTSHFEEYLSVKEAIILDLLRVVRLHRARLVNSNQTSSG